VAVLPKRNFFVPLRTVEMDTDTAADGAHSEPHTQQQQNQNQK